MRTGFAARGMSALLFFALAGCVKPAGDTASQAPPSRKTGLWEQTFNRDGKPGRVGRLKVCLDDATDGKLSVFGRHFATGACQRQVTREAGGVYHFNSVCTVDNGAVIKTMGVAAGDFASGYKVHSEVNVTGAPFGPMNGIHVVDITARYDGPCPQGVKPGDVELGSGMKINISRLPQIAEALENGKF